MDEFREAGQEWRQELCGAPNQTPMFPKTDLFNGPLSVFWLGSLLFFLGCDGCERTSDTLLINNAPGGFPTFAYVDSYVGSAHNNDYAITSADTSASFSWSLTENHEVRPPYAAEVTVMAPGRPPYTNTNANFTAASSDLVGLGFRDEIKLRATVWVVWAKNDNKYNRRVDYVTEALDYFNAYSYSSMLGIEIEEVTIRDMRNDPDAFDLRDCESLTGQSCAGSLRTLIGNDPDRLNIYLVRKVGDSRNLATYASNAPDLILGDGISQDDTPHHLITHLFGLQHPDDIGSGLSSRNAAHGVNNLLTRRQFYTNGQVLRTHWGPQSAINSHFNARPGQFTRNCPHSLSDSYECPSIEKHDLRAFVSLGIAF